VRLGLGRAHLLLGEPAIAAAYARAILGDEPRHDAARGLLVRALLRARRFREALEASAPPAGTKVGVEGLAAQASALFRLQRNEEAERAYRRVLLLDPLHAEAHLRLGSGLTAPCDAVSSVAIERAVAALRAGETGRAVAMLSEELRQEPGHPIAHRILGETLYAMRDRDSMVAHSAEFQRLAERLPAPDLGTRPVAHFMPQLASLEPGRQRVALRALALFADELPRLVTIGGRHDLLLETERTTDDPSRSALRGRRTFDGRVWDDVRGIGGLRAATGIEALDEARGHGFDTLAHEIAHQAHLYSFPHTLRLRIRAMYERAVAEGRCLDFYAASNDAEYFGQGAEAFASLGKRPVYEATHGHTRFELMRVDPELHALIQGLIDLDPLDPDKVPAEERAGLLRAAIAAALRAGRPADAVTAVGLLPARAATPELAERARRAALCARSY
jgi:tetratricopeptide (TPR) repeat protein